MYFDEKVLANRNTRDKSPFNMLKPPAVLARSVEEKPLQTKRNKNTSLLVSNPNELCDWIKILLQEEQAGTKPNMSTEEIVAITDKLLEYNRIIKEQSSTLVIQYS